MGNPFQDQLLKAGLVNKKQAKKAKLEQHRNRKQNKEESTAEIRNKVREEQAAQAQRNRELNQLRAEENRQREQKAQVKQLIEDNRLDQDDRGERYNFVEQNQIKRIYVSEEMADQLSQGLLAIVKLGESYEVVPAKVARQVASRDKAAVIAFHEK
ncbi:MAG: DUF2058 domain-containing protein [Proteobacteria bacterium]|nr:DUF2058 domain-containing protein [Pseudomonadota bacterium]MBU1231937.1 DUF2058 domain-containing protein [Pseudomonadota bacterium]MBU1420528.1 DUF2058 domain-containing protein [Pseudomonadota bacterium]MBU1456091.1 DUF2058 domain-containing protein [Pseudomonadota bacterium]